MEDGSIEVGRKRGACMQPLIQREKEGLGRLRAPYSLYCMVGKMRSTCGTLKIWECAYRELVSDSGGMHGGASGYVQLAEATKHICCQFRYFN